MKKILLLALVVLLVSCGDRRPPGGLIPPEDMEKILADVHLADALAQSSYLRRLYRETDSLHYAQKVLAKYGYTQQQFDSTISWYAGYPEEYEQLYERIISRLSRQEGQLKMQYDDSIRHSGKANLWNGKDSIRLPQDGEQYKVPFSIALYGPGIYTISAEYRFFPNDSAILPRISSWLYRGDDVLGEAEKKYFPSMPMLKADSFVRYTLIDTLLPQDTIFDGLTGWLYDHEPKPGTWKKHAFLRNISIRYRSLDTIAEDDSPTGPGEKFRRMLRRKKPD